MGAEQWHGITVESNLSIDEIVRREKRSLTNFFGYEINVSPPPPELLNTMKRAKEISWTQAEGHFIPNIVMEQSSNFPSWKVKPGEWFWGRIVENGLPKDVAILEGNWVIIDGSQKPEYQEGAQMFENDPFVSTLKELRESGQIQLKPWTERIVNSGSRYGISYDEIQKSVNPAIAILLGVVQTQVRLPRALEYNLLGNMYHPEWGNTFTWDWLQEIYADNMPLLVGRSKNGGLASYDCTTSQRHGDHIGFRPLIVFPRVTH